MVESNLQQSPPEPSRADPPIKLKHSSKPERSHKRHKRKRKDAESETETLAPKPDPNQLLSGSNRFDSFRSSSSKRPKHRRREPSGTESSRKWVYSSRDSSSYKDKVVVVSYNILGVENALKHPDLYVKVPSKLLEWDRRKKLIRKEVDRYNASILCLQEVDRFDDLDDLFQKDGFKGVYKARTGEAYDGCAIFWKEELFTLLHQENIEFQSFGLRNNVAQLCVLKMNQNHSELDANTQSADSSIQSRRLVIGNIHVLFNPKRGDIKLGQVRMLLEKASKLSREWGCIPVVICGDLNSIPQSPIYEFLASSELDIQLYDRRKISRHVSSESGGFRSQDEKACSYWTSTSKPSYRWSEEELRLATGRRGVTHLQHNLKLCSAYIGVPSGCRTRDNYGEPLATSYHSEFLGTVDYIWHSDELVPLRVLETLPLDILKRNGGLPSKKWGSDHLALVCELAFTDGCDGS
ncbi:hypothetical protein UlMin_008552 [Ulmus minor]